MGGKNLEIANHMHFSVSAGQTGLSHIVLGKPLCGTLAQNIIRLCAHFMRTEHTKLALCKHLARNREQVGCFEKRQC